MLKKLIRFIHAFNATTLPGKYAFFTICGKNEWTIIINKNWKQHLAFDYDEKDDIARLKVRPKKNPIQSGCNIL